MGSGASIDKSQASSLLEQEQLRPLDASDLLADADCRAEVIRLRAAIAKVSKIVITASPQQQRRRCRRRMKAKIKAATRIQAMARWRAIRNHAKAGAGNLLLKTYAGVFVHQTGGMATSGYFESRECALNLRADGIASLRFASEARDVSGGQGGGGGGGTAVEWTIMCQWNVQQDTRDVTLARVTGVEGCLELVAGSEADIPDQFVAHVEDWGRSRKLKLRGFPTAAGLRLDPYEG